jgi:hypothetical protein
MRRGYALRDATTALLNRNPGFYRVTSEGPATLIPPLEAEGLNPPGVDSAKARGRVFEVSYVGYEQVWNGSPQCFLVGMGHVRASRPATL